MGAVSTLQDGVKLLDQGKGRSDRLNCPQTRTIHNPMSCVTRVE